MSHFYRKAIAVFSTLVLLSAAIAVTCVKLSYIEAQLLPAKNSDLTWFASAHSDHQTNGDSTVVIHETEERLKYSFTLLPKSDAPYAGVSLALGTIEPPQPSVDLSMYSSLSFNGVCNVVSTLTITINTEDAVTAQSGSSLGYRPAIAHFSCKPKARDIVIDLQHLEVPDWWLNLHNVDLASRQYSLDKATHINFGVSSQTPMHQNTQVIIESVSLHGRAWFWFFVLTGSLVLLWAGFTFWWVRQYTKYMIEMLEEKSNSDKQFYAQRELTLQSQGDKNKNAVLEYLSQAYADPELNVEVAVSALGINRTKMNSILKDVVGLTFSAYLNKLRLTEAARLLAQSENANVAEIAYAVGYNNVSYFNKLFKDEYACTPKVYKSLLQSETA